MGTLGDIDDDIPAPHDNMVALDDRVVETSLLLLALRAFGRTATDAIVRDVGSSYEDNATVATLAALSRQALRPRDLHDLLGLPTPTVSRLLDRLEAAGDLERHAGDVPGDDRAVTLRITRTGRRRARTIERSILDDAAAVETSAKHALTLIETLLGGPPPPPTSMSASRSVADVCLFLGQFGLRLGRLLHEATGDPACGLALCVLISGGGSSRPSVVADSIGLTTGGTTKVLDRLEHAGHIERTYGDDGDRRAVRLTVTDAGAARMRAIADHLRPDLGALHGTLQEMVHGLHSGTR